MSLSKVSGLKADVLADMLQNSSTIEELCLKIGYRYSSDRIQELVRNKCTEFGLDSEILYMHTPKFKMCTSCKKVKLREEFYDSRSLCKECVREIERKKYASKMDALTAYKKTLKCKKCGDSRYYVLDFHHIDPAKKDYTISHNSHAKLETIMKEIHKCIPLCSNCHREFHYLEKTQNMTLQQFLEA